MKKPKWAYKELTLVRLIRQTKSIDDLVSIVALYKDLENQGDITITQRIKRAVQMHQHYLIYNF